MKKNNLYLLLFILWMLLVLIFSSIPSSRIPDLHINFSDKLLHVGQYFIAGLLLFFYSTSRTYTLRKLELSFTYLAVFSILDELHQLFIQGRSVCIWDATANVTGVFFALLFSIILIKGFRKRTNFLVRS
jgi:VanZ family protein